MRPRHLFKVFLLSVLLIATLVTSVYAAFTIKVTYSSGGTVAPASDTVQLENGQIIVEDSSPITLLITPNEGYTIHSVFRDGEQMEISGEQQQSITVIPKADVDIQVVFLPTDGEVQTSDEPVFPEKPEIDPQTPDTQEQPSDTPETHTDGIESQPQEKTREIDWQKILFIAAIAGAAVVTVLIMIRMFRKKIKNM